MSRGVSWSAIGQFGAEGIRIVTGIALARWLSPTTFGLVGMVWVLASFAQVLLDFGFGAALVQRKEPSADDLSTVFWFNLAMGSLLGLALGCSAWGIAWFYGDDRLVGITMALSVNFPLLGLGLIQRTLLQKGLRFRQLAMVEIMAALGSGAVAMGLAWLGAQAWALVAWLLVRSALTTLGTWSVGDWRPRLRFSVHSFRSMAPFAMRVAAGETLGYATQNADRIIVGRFLGAAALGLHEQAMRLVLIPVAAISLMVARVLFPSMVLLQDDPDGRRALFLRMVRITLFLCAPVVVGLAAVSRPFVAFVYGPAWEGLVPLLPIVCGLGVIGTILALTRGAFLSVGRADTHLGVVAARGVPMVGGSAAGVPWGLLGVATGKLAGSVLGLLLTMVALVRLVHASVGQQIANVLPVVGIAGGMGLAVYALDGALADAVPAGVALAIEVATGALLYPLFATLLRVRALGEVRELIRGFLARRSS